MSLIKKYQITVRDWLTGEMDTKLVDAIELKELIPCLNMLDDTKKLEIEKVRHKEIFKLWIEEEKKIK